MGNQGKAEAFFDDIRKEAKSYVHSKEPYHKTIEFVTLGGRRVLVMISTTPGGIMDFDSPDLRVVSTDSGNEAMAIVSVTKLEPDPDNAPFKKEEVSELVYLITGNKRGRYTGHYLATNKQSPEETNNTLQLYFNLDL